MIISDRCQTCHWPARHEPNTKTPRSIRPEGAPGCSHGCSGPARRDAKPVGTVVFLYLPRRRVGGRSHENGHDGSFAPPGRLRWSWCPNSTGCAKPTGFAPPVATARDPFGVAVCSPARRPQIGRRFLAGDRCSGGDCTPNTYVRHARTRPSTSDCIVNLQIAGRHQSIVE